jgi:hypothetical protein
MLKARDKVQKTNFKDRDVPNSQIANYQIAELSNCRIVELPNCRIAELPNCRIAELPNCQIAELPNCPLQLFFILLISILQPLINNTVIIIKNTGPEA